MMLWHDPKLLFIHIPKTGGSSIEHTLHRCKLKQREGKVGQHAAMVTAYHYMNNPSEYIKFTVIRNPWDRILSYYLMCYKRNSFPQIDVFKNKKYVPFPEFYENLQTNWLHAEDSFHYLSVDGVIPKDLHILTFENIEQDFLSLFKMYNIDVPIDFPHVNINNRASSNLRNYLKSDPRYVDIISQLYKPEIEYFSFEYVPPEP